MINNQKVKDKLVNLNTEIKNLIPDIKEFIQIDRVSISEVKEGFMNGLPIQRVIIILRNSGCAWSLKEDGGCFMCGHLCGTLKGDKIDPEFYNKQIDSELNRYDFTNYPMLCLYNSGSFLNPDEIPVESRKYILEKINSINGIKKLIIESRPEYITSEIIDELETTLTNIDLEIGVGLETSNDQIRNLCLNKGFNQNEFVELGKRLSKSQIQLLAYILVKPPFLSESEAIKDTCNSIEFAFENGANIISIEPVSVQDFTLTSFLNEAGYYRPPWIWTVVEIVKRTHKLGFIRIGGFEFFPIPKIFTHNCSKCNSSFIKAIKMFNSSYEISKLNGINCKCKNEWLSDLEEELIPLPARINDIMKSINKYEILRRMQRKFDIRGPVNDRIKNIIYKSCSSHYN